MASFIQNRAKPVHGLCLVLLLSSTEVIGEKKKKKFNLRTGVTQFLEKCNHVF